MMSLDNILSFIEKKDISIRQFEVESDLANGTLNESKKRGADLSSKNIEKISKRYGAELVEAGFNVIDLKAFGREGYAIVKEDNKTTREDEGLKEEQTSILNLSKALADQAEANKIQAAANDKYAEGFKILSEVISSIEKNMARQGALADVGTNLNFVVASVKKISKIQDSGLKELKDNFSMIHKAQNDLSRDVHSKLDQSDEDGKRQGNRP